MNIVRPYQDHLFVQVDLDSLDRTESGIYIPDWQPGDKDAKQALVVAAPHGLSRERPLAFPGFDGGRYTYADLLDIPQPGETVYLKPNTFKPELEHPSFPGLFLVALDRVVAVKGIDGLRPFQGYVLGEPVWGDDVRVNEKGIRERVEMRHRRVGKPEEHLYSYWPIDEFITETEPLPIPFAVRVQHVGTPLRGQLDVVAAGDVILAHRMLYAYHAVKQKDDEEASARWMWQPPTVVIEGKEFIYVPRQCVMGKQLQSAPTASVESQHG